jgi:hypothetical protein
MLADFADYLHEHGAERITTAVALEWAVLPAGASQWWWQQRLSLPGLGRHREAPMTTTIPSTAVVPSRPVLSGQERLALAGFRAGYTGLTREARALDLRQFTTWCADSCLASWFVRE